MKAKVLEGTDLEDSFDIDEVVNIKENQVAEEFLWQAGKYVRYATLLAHAKTRVHKAKLALEVKEAELDANIRATAVTSGVKVTEGGIRSMIATTAAYQDVANALIKMKEDEEILIGMVRALEQRKDCLISYASLLKIEAAGGLTVYKSKLDRGVTD